jgi:predicted metal-dependent peptidase
MPDDNQSPGVQAAMAARAWPPARRQKEEQEAAKRVMRARVRLLLSNGFFGTLATRLQYLPDWSQPTAWINGQVLGYNPAYVCALEPPEVEGLLAHEVMHVVLGHVWRRGERDHQRWNMAADFAIDPLLVAANLDVPDATVDPQYDGLAAEHIYALREPPEMPPGPGKSEPQDGEGEEGGSAPQDGEGEPQEGDEGEGEGEPQEGDGGDGEPSDEGSGDGGGGKPEEDEGEGESDQDWSGATKGEVRDAPNPDQAAEQEAEWKVATVQAAKAARNRGQAPGWMQGLITEMLAPKVNWVAELRQFMQQVARADYSWRQPSPRYTEVYLPRLRSETMPPVVVALDTSGSMWDQHTLATLSAELGAILGEVKPERIDVLYVDAAVAHVQTYEPGDDLKFEPRGGGGTDFRPVFDWVEQQDEQPACVIYLTDLAGFFPDEAPPYPVLWGVVTDARYPAGEPPFGDVLPINLD